jgi:hypothetical protein
MMQTYPSTESYDSRPPNLHSLTFRVGAGKAASDGASAKVTSLEASVPPRVVKSAPPRPLGRRKPALALLEAKNLEMKVVDAARHELYCFSVCSY